jgi:diguanylate cyclase (GGDEF)-like protein
VKDCGETALPEPAAMDVLCPMHARLDREGRIVHAGPMLARLDAQAGVVGRRFADLFELRRPRIGDRVDLLMQGGAVRLRLRLRQPPATGLKGVLVPVEGGAVVNLSFGIALQEAVRDFSLTAGDFAATDLAVEMLYLIEAKSVAMEASRKLNLRLQGARIAAEEKAFTDTLTGLGNRRVLEPVLTRLIDGGSEFALLNLDLDFFKAVNDTLGHAAGDHVLQQAAGIMRAETRDSDRVLRLGGDEFVVILEGPVDRVRVDDIARRLIARLEAPMQWQGRALAISASIGAALSRGYGAGEAEAMIARMMEDADRALYAAKAAGRGRHVVHDPTDGGAP